MKSLEERIREIHIFESNLHHIARTGRINGSLFLSIREAMMQYGKDCATASLEKAAENALLVNSEGNSGDEFLGADWTMYQIDKSSITSPDNIVTL